jgi:hypothetical protein
LDLNHRNVRDFQHANKQPTQQHTMGVPTPLICLLLAFGATPSVHAAAFLPVRNGVPKPLLVDQHENNDYNCCPLLPFSGALRTRSSSSPISPVVLQATKGKKISMAEKRRQRAKRLPARPVTSTPPRPDAPNQVLAESPSEQPDDLEETNDRPAAAAAAVGNDDGADATMTKAQQLLQSQRKSVAMLTLVKQRLEALPAAEIQSALEQQGFWYSDSGDSSADSNTGIDTGFLQSQHVLRELQQEGVTLYESGAMSADMDRLAAGEYCCALAGGQDQYVTCPRSIELVVSTTKHLNKAVLMEADSNDSTSTGTGGEENKASTGVVLDDSRCMANMRTFDRQAWKAAQVLFTGESTSTDDMDQDSTSSANTGSKDGDESSAARPFGRTVTDDIDGQEDRRKISLCYYLVPENWSHGGDMVFQQKNADGDDKTTEVHVPAVRDRLVIWKSDTALHRQEPWKGSDDMPLASCIELHLIEKA